MKFKLHHGKTKLYTLGDLEGVDIVLTTYHTVSAEWKGGTGSEHSVMFSVHWRRIVLDEGMFFFFNVQGVCWPQD